MVAGVISQVLYLKFQLHFVGLETGKDMLTRKGLPANMKELSFIDNRVEEHFRLNGNHCTVLVSVRDHCSLYRQKRVLE